MFAFVSQAESPRVEVQGSRSQGFFANVFETFSSASEFSWRYRMSSRSADALQAALPEQQLQTWSQRYRCPPRAASVEHLPRLLKLSGELADRELAFLMQAGELAEKPRCPSKRSCQDENQKRMKERLNERETLLSKDIPWLLLLCFIAILTVFRLK